MFSKGGKSTDPSDSSSASAVRTTEVVTLGQGETIPGPDLPVSVSNHCMTRINRTHAILTGGSGEETSSKVDENMEFPSSSKLSTERPSALQNTNE